MTSPLISTTWCFQPCKPYIFCESSSYSYNKSEFRTVVCRRLQMGFTCLHCEYIITIITCCEWWTERRDNLPRFYIRAVIHKKKLCHWVERQREGSRWESGCTCMRGVLFWGQWVGDSREIRWDVDMRVVWEVFFSRTVWEVFLAEQYEKFFLAKQY